MFKLQSKKQTGRKGRKGLKVMKRTAYLIEEVLPHGGGWILSENKITCEVCGEWDDGAKVWQDIHSGKQYGLLRMHGNF